MSGREGSVSHPAVGVRIRRLPHGQGLPLPTPASPGASGADLCAAVAAPLILAPGERGLVPTGLAIQLPAGCEAQVRPRSGLARRSGITIPNAPGTIDADYTGEIQVILLNTGAEAFEVKRGDRIAQLVVAPVLRAVWEEVEQLAPTERGGGGFGHSGVAPLSEEGS